MDSVGVSVLGDALSAAAAEGDRPGYRCAGRVISYREMDDAADRFAVSLLRRGFQKGDRIAVNALNQSEWAVAYFGAARIGVITIGLNVHYRDVELEYILNQSETRAVVSVARLGEMDFVAYFSEFAPRVPTVTEFIFIGAAGRGAALDFKSLVSAPLSSRDRDDLDVAGAEVRPQDIALVVYTSGTTGRPKGVAMTHRSQLAAARALAHHTRLGPDDVVLSGMPLSNVGWVTCGIVTTLLARATSVLVPEFDPGEVIRRAHEAGATVWAGVPAMHAELLADPALPSLDAARIRLVLTGGSNADPALLTRLGQAFPSAKVMNVYALTETSGAVVMSAWDSDADTLATSIGQPLDGVEMRVVSEHGSVVPAGKIGELHFRGAAVASGYFRMAEDTAATFDEEGWLRTGDLGYVDDRGNVFLVGRIKDMYIQGGFNVYPTEVEQLIARHPAVRQVAGIGVPDPVLGEVGRYYVVPRGGTAPTAGEILAFCQAHLSDYKVPRQIVFRRSLPVTPSGRIMKSRLREELHAHGRGPH